jgi:protein ImuB
MRLACLHVPDFPLAALLRLQPELRGQAVAVIDGSGPRAKVVAVSPEAARSGIAIGFSVAQATSIASNLATRSASPDAVRAAQGALCDAAACFSPRLEDAGAGIVYLDLEGLVGSLFASEAQLATAVAQRAIQFGLEAHVGVASSKVAARLAARDGGGVVVVPPGEEWSFLAPLPLAILEPGRELAVLLQRWGIHRIGDLAALPIEAVGTRLGPQGVQLVQRARGEDEHPLQLRPLSPCFEEGIDLDYGIETLEPFLFVLRGLLDRLTARLQARGLVCGDLGLSLCLTTSGRDERTVVVAAPSNDVKSLLTLVRLQLEAHPPGAAVESLRVTAVPERLRAAQLDLFCPGGPAPARLAATLARLTAICGAERVGAPVAVEDHRPDAFGMTSFQGVMGLGGCGVRKNDQHPLTPNPSTPNPLIVALALRAIRPPLAIEVFCECDRPAFVRGDRFAGRVVHAAGPWRVQGQWWKDDRYARDYYDAQLSDGCVYRLYRDLAARGWFVDGVYD